MKRKEFPQTIFVVVENYDADEDTLVVVDGDTNSIDAFHDKHGEYVATYYLKAVDRVRVHVGWDKVK